MTDNPNEHPPVRGKMLAATLSLTKRRRGASQLETLRGDGGFRLAAQIRKLKERGHRFRTAREGKEGHARYWWIGFDPGGDPDHSVETSEASHNKTPRAGVPPCPPLRGRPSVHRGDGRHHA